MGWFKDLFKKNREPTKETVYADMMNGYAPIFSQFGENIYASDVVQQCLYRIVVEMKKLQPRHVRKKGYDITPVSGSIQDVLDNPNMFMTTSDFLEKITWLLLLNYNVFIFPTYNEGNLTGLYPLQPAQVDFLEDLSGIVIVRFTFKNGYRSEVPYSSVIHVKSHYSVNEFMGGNEQGQPDNNGILDTLRLNDTMLKGIAKAMNASYSINAVVKYNTLLDDGTMQKNITELEEKLKNGKSGFMGMDLKNEIIPFKRDIKLIDKDTLQFIDSKILRNYGVSLPILIGDYNKEQFEAFYQNALEDKIISYSQAFTKALFTRQQIKGYKNEIQFYSGDLQFLNNNQKIEFIKEVGGRGALTNGFMLSLFGIDPLIAGDTMNKRYMSLNYVDVDIANQYQLDSKNKKEDQTNIDDPKDGDIQNE